MYEPQHFVDLHDNNGGYGDSNSWLSGGDPPLSPSVHRTLSNATASGTASNVDRVLFNDLVEIVPLVQSLIDRKAKSSFTRRGSMVYTKTPARESLSKKQIEPKGKNGAQSIPTRKRRDQTDKDQGKNTSNNLDESSFSMRSSTALATEREREELIALREQVEDLQKKLVEKEELQKLAETSKIEVNTISAKLEELRLQAAEKDSVIKSSQIQLSDAKIKLADKQAALEKLQWEAMTSSKKVESLQEDLSRMQGEISSFMSLFEGLNKSSPTVAAEDYDVTPYYLNNLSHRDGRDVMKMRSMDEAKDEYIAAVAAAKEKHDEDSIAAATIARLRLQSIVFQTSGVNLSGENLY